MDYEREGSRKVWIMTERGQEVWIMSERGQEEYGERVQDKYGF
jgi:hypothetical protein